MERTERKLVLAAAKDAEDISEVESVVVSSASAGGAASAAPQVEPALSLDLAARRMWTKADFLHMHATSGAVHTVVGLVYLLDIVACDAGRLLGFSTEEHVVLDVLLISMLFGAVNALTGLQPTLLPRPFRDTFQLLGIGKDGNLNSGGFVNIVLFYFILTYQSLRVLPFYPMVLQPLDPVFASVTILAIAHTGYLLFSWVDRGKLLAWFAAAMMFPLLLNVPPSLHLLFQGQVWVEQLTEAYPGWPQVFFSANYALAWAGSVVTLVFSLYDRKVISLEQRLVLTVLFGAITLAVIPLQAYLYVPQWFQGDWLVMLTLTPP